MIPVRIEGATRVLGAPQGVGSEDCSQLAIRDLPSKFGNQMWSKWEPTPHDLQLLNAGCKLYLVLHGVTHPMVCIAIGTHIDGDPEPDGGFDADAAGGAA